MCDSMKNFCIQEYLQDSEDPESSSVEGNDYDKELEDVIVSKQDIATIFAHENYHLHVCIACRFHRLKYVKCKLLIAHLIEMPSQSITSVMFDRRYL